MVVALDLMDIERITILGGGKVKLHHGDGLVSSIRRTVLSQKNNMIALLETLDALVNRYHKIPGLIVIYDRSILLEWEGEGERRRGGQESGELIFSVEIDPYPEPD